MMDGSNDRMDTTESSEKDRLSVLVQESSPDGLAALLLNPALDERHVRLLLRRVELPTQTVEMIAGNRKWLRSEAVRLALVVHPHAPRRLALTLLRQLLALDLVRVSMNITAPPEIRCIAEELVIERVRQLPLGEKLTLARRGPARVAGALLADGHQDVISVVLQNPFLTEAQVVRVLWRASVAPPVVVAIAEHSKWSVRYAVRLALVRNVHTPVAIALRILPNLLLTDLRELVRNGSIPGHLREAVRKELARRSGVGAGRKPSK